MRSCGTRSVEQGCFTASKDACREPRSGRDDSVRGCPLSLHNLKTFIELSKQENPGCRRAIQWMAVWAGSLKRYREQRHRALRSHHTGLATLDQRVPEAVPIGDHDEDRKSTR